jgi:SAM-dependent methyltransferase
LASRRWKGEKILRLLDLAPAAVPWRVLEVGTGVGGIAHYLATHPRVRCEVTSVDVVDVREAREGYRFHLVEGTALPFADGSFDAVVSNHVIEHVGDRRAQLAHLRECRRVLAREGRGYLAVPNRWMLVEPHYRLAFLSWLPREWRSRYLRLAGKGAAYDCEPLAVAELEALFAEAGLTAASVTVRALRETLAIEGARSLARRCVARIPDRAWERLLPVFPTLVYRFAWSPESASTVREVPAR